MNPMAFMQIKSLWDRFENNHPKFPRFLSVVSNNVMKEGTIIEVKVTDPDGTDYTTNLKLTADDRSIIEEFKNSLR